MHLEYTKCMRTDLTFDQCEKILLAEHYGHLGCVENHEPFVYPVTYLYKDGYIYSHTTEGAKTEMLRKNPHVCLQVEQVTTGYEWSSVMCHGIFQELTNHDEVHAVQLLLAEQYANISLAEGKVPVSPVLEYIHSLKAEQIRTSIVYRIDIQKTTGRAEKHSKNQ